MSGVYEKICITNLLRESPNGLEEDSEGRVHYLYQHRTKSNDWSDTRRVLGQVEALRLTQRVKRLTRKGTICVILHIAVGRDGSVWTLHNECVVGSVLEGKANMDEAFEELFIGYCLSPKGKQAFRDVIQIAADLEVAKVADVPHPSRVMLVRYDEDDWCFQLMMTVSARALEDDTRSAPSDAVDWDADGYAALPPEYLKGEVIPGQPVAVRLHPSAVVFGIALVAYAVFSDNRCPHPSRKDTLQEQLDWLRTRPKDRIWLPDEQLGLLLDECLQAKPSRRSTAGQLLGDMLLWDEDETPVRVMEFYLMADRCGLWVKYNEELCQSIPEWQFLVKPNPVTGDMMPLGGVLMDREDGHPDGWLQAGLGQHNVSRTFAHILQRVQKPDFALTVLGHPAATNSEGQQEDAEKASLRLADALLHRVEAVAWRCNRTLAPKLHGDPFWRMFYGISVLGVPFPHQTLAQQQWCPQRQVWSIPEALDSTQPAAAAAAAAPDAAAAAILQPHRCSVPLLQLWRTAGLAQMHSSSSSSSSDGGAAGLGSVGGSSHVPHVPLDNSGTSAAGMESNTLPAVQTLQLNCSSSSSVVGDISIVLNAPNSYTAASTDMLVFPDSSPGKRAGQGTQVFRQLLDHTLLGELCKVGASGHEQKLRLLVRSPAVLCEVLLYLEAHGGTFSLQQLEYVWHGCVQDVLWYAGSVRGPVVIIRVLHTQSSISLLQLTLQLGQQEASSSTISISSRSDTISSQRQQHAEESRMLAYELGLRLAAKLHPGGVYPAVAAAAGAALTAVALVVPLAQAAADNRQLEEVDGLQKASGAAAAAAAHCDSSVSAMSDAHGHDDDSSSSSSQSSMSASSSSSLFTDDVSSSSAWSAEHPGLPRLVREVPAQLQEHWDTPDLAAAGCVGPQYVLLQVLRLLYGFPAAAAGAGSGSSSGSSSGWSADAQRIYAAASHAAEKYQFAAAVLGLLQCSSDPMVLLVTASSLGSTVMAALRMAACRCDMLRWLTEAIVQLAPMAASDSIASAALQVCGCLVQMLSSSDQSATVPDVSDSTLAMLQDTGKTASRRLLLSSSMLADKLLFSHVDVSLGHPFSQQCVARGLLQCFSSQLGIVSWLQDAAVAEPAAVSAAAAAAGDSRFDSMAAVAAAFAAAAAHGSSSSSGAADVEAECKKFLQQHRAGWMPAEWQQLQRTDPKLAVVQDWLDNSWYSF